MSDIGGVWRTVGGRRIFIKDGEDLQTAMKKSGKFGKKKEKKSVDYMKEYLEKEGYNKKDADDVAKIIDNMGKKDAYEEYKKNYNYDKEKPEGAKFNDMLERHNVRTFADDVELREMSKMSNKDLVEYEKSKGSFKTSDNAEFARAKELYYETGLAKYKNKMDEILKKHNIR